MNTIAHNIQTIRATIPQGVELICVSKYFSSESILQAYDYGERCFAESRGQELMDKASRLPKDIKWHFIGHLQTNKVKQVVSCAEMIESVDSIHLLDAIEKAAAQIGKIQKCLLEIHVAQEATKSGFSPHEFATFFNSTDWTRYPHIKICGLMGMASNTDDQERIRQDFRLIKTIADLSGLRTISMGMSGDYMIAIQEGATMVRIGSAIFANRILPPKR